MSKTRKNDATNNINKMLIILVVLICIMLAIVIFLLYQIKHRPLPPFQAVAQNGQRMTLLPSETPNLLSTTVTKWAVRAATTAYSLDFTQTDQQITAAVSPFFTQEGWAAYWRSLQRTLGIVRQNKLFVYCVVSGAPVISNQGALPGKGQVKRVQMPFLVTYESTEGTQTRSFLVTLMIVNVPTTENPSAMAIDQFVMR